MLLYYLMPALEALAGARKTIQVITASPPAAARKIKSFAIRAEFLAIRADSRPKTIIGVVAAATITTIGTTTETTTGTTTGTTRTTRTTGTIRAIVAIKSLNKNKILSYRPVT